MAKAETAPQQLAAAEATLRRFQEAIAAGVDPVAVVDPINRARAGRDAARACPAHPEQQPELYTEAQVSASVEAIFLSTFVLISQNRMATLADTRADLDLQMGLLAEHEITRLITLVTAMAEQMNVAAAHNPELAELSRDVAPEKVMQKMEAHERATEPQ